MVLCQQALNGWFPGTDMNVAFDFTTVQRDGLRGYYTHTVDKETEASILWSNL